MTLFNKNRGKSKKIENEPASMGSDTFEPMSFSGSHGGPESFPSRSRSTINKKMSVDQGLPRSATSKFRSESSNPMPGISPMRRKSASLSLDKRGKIRSMADSEPKSASNAQLSGHARSQSIPVRKERSVEEALDDALKFTSICSNSDSDAPSSKRIFDSLRTIENLM